MAVTAGSFLSESPLGQMSTRESRDQAGKAVRTPISDPPKMTSPSTTLNCFCHQHCGQPELWPNLCSMEETDTT